MTNGDFVRMALFCLKQCSSMKDCDVSSDFITAFENARINLMYLVDVSNVCESNSDKKSKFRKSD